MQKIFKAVGGRKSFYFLLLLLINFLLLLINKFNGEFSNFCLMLYSIVIVGNVAAKFSGGKGE